MDDIKIDNDRALITRVAELKVQSMLFDMAIDWETLTLKPKTRQAAEPVWLQRWKQNRKDADFDELIDIDRE